MQSAAQSHQFDNPVKTVSIENCFFPSPFQDLKDTLVKFKFLPQQTNFFN